MNVNSLLIKRFYFRKVANNYTHNPYRLALLLFPAIDTLTGTVLLTTIHCQPFSHSLLTIFLCKIRTIKQGGKQKHQRVEVGITKRQMCQPNYFLLFRVRNHSRWVCRDRTIEYYARYWHKMLLCLCFTSVSFYSMFLPCWGCNRIGRLIARQVAENKCHNLAKKCHAIRLRGLPSVLGLSLSRVRQ